MELVCPVGDFLIEILNVEPSGSAAGNLNALLINALPLSVGTSIERSFLPLFCISTVDPVGALNIPLSTEVPDGDCFVVGLLLETGFAGGFCLG